MPQIPPATPGRASKGTTTGAILLTLAGAGVVSYIVRTLALLLEDQLGIASDFFSSLVLPVCTFIVGLLTAHLAKGPRWRYEPLQKILATTRITLLAALGILGVYSIILTALSFGPDF